jgi:hypothetical protein
VLLAITEGGLVAISVAAIAAVPATIVAVGGLRGAKAAQDVRDRLGVPNGKGNVVEMQERGLSEMGKMRDEMRDLSDEMRDLSGLMVQHGIALSAHDERIRTLEQG